jgi:sialic acid synthase SpsE
MTNIPEGYGFVAGRSRENAKAILAAAKAAGVDAALVQTTLDGYLAPEAAVRQYEGKNFEAPDDTEKAVLTEGAPDETWKNAAIKDWAEDHGVDLGDATKKADMLAAISDASTKEE